MWLEEVPDEYIKDVKLTPDQKGVKIKVIGGAKEKTLTLGEKEYSFSDDEFYLEVESPVLWTPENPHLYHFTLKSGNDEIKSYFALREIKIEQGKIKLNGQEIFLNSVLDQGYFPDGVFLPATFKGFEDDIAFLKECGFNALRKHIKLEPDYFYYLCDKMGILVMQDFINNGKYNFVRDTALPTIGVKKMPMLRANKKQKTQFEKTSVGVVNALYNHPSVVYYTIFNEGWGQFDSTKYYHFFKNLDSTRIYDTASGWFKGCESDVESEHIYFKKAKINESDKPIVISEFGGYSFKINEHSFNLKNTYGYRFFDDQTKFESALISLYEDEILPLKQKGLCGAVLTQLSDVEDETNGLLTYDRKIRKISPEKLKAVFDK